MPASACLGETPFSVIDVETTGLYPTSDRIVEIAVLRLRPDGSVEDEYETLVNPQRDVGPTRIHQITGTDVMNAPVFAEVAVDVGMRLQNAVVVGHNLRFDLGFLHSEYARLELGLPELPRLCTLRMAHQLLPIRARRLCDCCAELGIEHTVAHSALGDARATAQVLRKLVEVAGEEGVRDLGGLGCQPLILPPPWISGRPSDRRCTRGDAARKAAEARAYLPRLVNRLAGDEASSADEAEYMAVLDRALEDRTVTEAEGQALVEVATRIGLTRADVERAHFIYLESLAAAAWADGTVTDAERRDLLLVGEMLGVAVERVLKLFEGPPTTLPAKTQTTNLRGKRVCFTGSLDDYTCKGEVLTRGVAEALATQAGLVVCASVTKKLDVLVVADSNTLSTKARKARDYGTRVIAAPAFFAAIGVNIE